jgi:hypothetical protein
MKSLWLPVIALLLVGLGLTVHSSGWLPINSEQSNSKKPNSASPSKAEIVQLQSLADNACSCESLTKIGEGVNCWSAYKRAVSKYAVTELSSACDPISTTRDCFGDRPEDGPCVSKGFDVGGLPADVNSRICSNAEAQAVEAAATAAYSSAKDVVTKDPQAAGQVSNEAMIKVLLEIRNGRLHPKPTSDGVCE